MDTTYAAWIQAHVVGDPTGDCVLWTRRMQQAFPALRRVRGHVLPATEALSAVKPAEGYPHWWLETATGEIVDPTVTQFPWPIVYTPWEEGQPEPTGKCYECGAYCYAGKEFCCEEHCASYAASLMGMIR